MARDYSKRRVKVEKKSGFDKSHRNLFTAKVGTLIPVLCDELVPNSTVKLDLAAMAQLAPLATDTFMNVKLKYAAFFVPSRILFPGFEKWLAGDGKDDNTVIYFEESGDMVITSSTQVSYPTFNINAISGGSSSPVSYSSNIMGPGTLGDYLGFKTYHKGARAELINASGKYNLLPFLGYHRIWNDWFRNPLIQKDIYSRVQAAEGYDIYTAASSIYTNPRVSGALDTTSRAHNMFADETYWYQLRQANFDKDMFTAAMPTAQKGKAQAVSIGYVSGNTSGFTISSLRTANALQQFAERNMLAGPRLVDYVKAQYGADLSDGVAQRSILLGTGSFDVYSKSVYQNAPSTDNTNNTMNPFENVGAKYGDATASGMENIISNFTTQEPGYLYVLAWLSPKAVYGTGIDPMLTRYSTDSVTDLANPMLAGTGNEPISTALLNGSNKVENWNNFGYMDRYFAWKDKNDSLHGYFRPGESLEAFASNRSFVPTSDPSISTSFIQIPTDYLNNVFATNVELSNYCYWSDMFFNYKVVQPLPQYSIPTLEDVGAEHGVDITIRNGGTQIQ